MKTCNQSQETTQLVVLISLDQFFNEIFLTIDVFNKPIFIFLSYTIQVLLMST